MGVKSNQTQAMEIKPIEGVSVAEAGAQAAQTDSQTNPQTAQTPRLDYRAIFGELNRNKQLTDDEKKRRRRDKMFAAIGDGISALANLHFTAQGAPNAYSGASTLSAKAKERWDRIKAEREANAREYANGMLHAAQAEENSYWKQAANDMAAAKMQGEADRFNAKMAFEMQKHGDAMDLGERKMQQAAEQFEAKQKQQDKFHRDKMGAERAKLNETRSYHNARLNGIGGIGGGGASGKTYTFPMPDGKTLQVNKDKVNDATASALFNKLPKAVRENYMVWTDQVERFENGRPIYRKKMPSTETMLQAIGENMSDKGMQVAVMQLAGQNPKDLWSGQKITKGKK